MPRKGRITKFTEKTLKIIIKNSVDINQCLPLNITYSFVLESLLFHYEDLKNEYCKTLSITKTENLLLQKINKSTILKQ